MATRLYLEQRNLSVPDDPDVSSDADRKLLTALEAGSFNLWARTTVAGPTAGLQITDGIGGTVVSWWFRVNGVTISAAIVKNLWMAESDMSANVGAQVIIDRCDGTGTHISTVQNSEKGTELPVTTRAAQNWSTGTVTNTTFAAGDYIRLRVYGNDVGTMGSGFNFNMKTGGAGAGLDGDSWIEFTETITAYAPGASADPFPYIGGGYYGQFHEYADRARRLWRGWTRRPSGVLVPG